MMSLYLLSLLGLGNRTSVRAPDHPSKEPQPVAVNKGCGSFISQNSLFKYMLYRSGAIDLAKTPAIFNDSFSFPIVSDVTSRHFAIVS